MPLGWGWTCPISTLAGESSQRWTVPARVQPQSFRNCCPRIASPQISAAPAPQERGRPSPTRWGEAQLPSEYDPWGAGAGIKADGCAGHAARPLSRHAPHALRRCRRVHVATSTRRAQPSPHHHKPVVGSGSGLKTTYMVFSMPASVQAAPSHLQRAAPWGYGKSLNACESQPHTTWGRS